MKLVLLFTTIVLLTTAVAQETHPDCEYHGQTYKFQESWPNNCARCTCLQASTVICGPDVSILRKIALSGFIDRNMYLSQLSP